MEVATEKPSRPSKSTKPINQVEYLVKLTAEEIKMISQWASQARSHEELLYEDCRDIDDIFLDCLEEGYEEAIERIRVLECKFIYSEEVI